MEYERIHKVQGGIISPSKLRMKLVGAAHYEQKKDGSNCNSSRTSPSKFDDSEYVKDSLLASSSGVFDDTVSSMEVSSVINATVDEVIYHTGHENVGRLKTSQFSKSDSSNLSSVHPMRTLEDENLDYDSNTSSSSFEFHKGERSVNNPISRSLLRPISSKWNDAEKWINNKQNVHANYSKNALQYRPNQVRTRNGVRVAPDSIGYVKQVDVSQSASQMGPEKSSLNPSATHHMSGQASEVNELIALCPEYKDLQEVGSTDFSCEKNSSGDTDVPAIRAVSMRDMGTEMTPIPSQEPSMTSTPIGATTPLRSPTSSIPSTPRGGGQTSTPVDSESCIQVETGRKELSDEELKLKTRKEILALGVQLGKMNIAAWARKEDNEKMASAVEATSLEEIQRIEFENRAAAWEEAEKSKHNARFKHEEIKIEAWDSQQKAKLEKELRRVEAQVEQKRAHAQAKMVKKIAIARQRSEQKRAGAEARKNRQAEKVAAQAEYIRQTGRIPASRYMCCGWS